MREIQNTTSKGQNPTHTKGPVRGAIPRRQEDRTMNELQIGLVVTWSVLVVVAWLASQAIERRSRK